MDKALYQVVLTGELVPGFGRQAVLASLARLFQTSAARLMPVFDGVDYAVDDLLIADEAAELQKRLERVGVRARIDRVVGGRSGHPRTGLRLPRQNDPVEAGLMRCPACGHQQLVAKRCDECGIVFADFNRGRKAAQRVPGAAERVAPPLTAKPPRRPSDIHATASAGWRESWVDEGDDLPTEQYQMKLFIGPRSSALAEDCQRMLRGRRTRLVLSWAWAAVISPFLWAMYHKMWGWALLIFFSELLIPVVLITAGAQAGVSEMLVTAGTVLLVVNRIVWPVLLKSLYCRHARNTIRYMNRLAPTFAADIEVANRGGSSRTGVFVGIVLAIVGSLLAWNLVDSIHAHWMKPTQAFSPTEQPLEPDGPTPPSVDEAVTAQNETLANENRWVATRNRLRLLGQQINSWYGREGSPQDPQALDLAGLAVLIPLDPDSLLDGWGRQVSYRHEGRGYRLVSAGPDGEFGNSDDIEYRRVLEP